MNISAINIYPIKSLKGIAIDSARVESRGFRHDRRWMLVDERRQFLTQRAFPVMATIAVEVTSDGLRVMGETGEIRVPFEPATGETARVKVWSSSVRASFYDGEIDEWFSRALGTKCRLVAMTDESSRKVNPYYAVRRFRDEVSFADGYPFLLANEASLADLNTRVDDPVPMTRFRPNIVIKGAEPFSEDEWKRIRIGSTVFHVVKPCGRCVITTVDQTSGEKTGPEPLKTLAKFRTKRGKVLFGENLIADYPGAVINLGDSVTVIE